MFVDSVVQVNSLVREVEDVKVMHVDQNCIYSIQDYCQHILSHSCTCHIYVYTDILCNVS